MYISRSLTYIDKTLLFCLGSFFLISSFCMAAYVPASIFRHIFIWFFGIALIIYMHSQNYDVFLKISKILFVIAIALIIATYIKSGAIKGSRRWILIFGMSLQPSELLKSSSIILTSYYIYKENYLIFFLIYLVDILLLIKQPDFGSILLLLSIMMIQLFISNTRLRGLILLGVISMIFAVFAIKFLPHVRSRIFNFITGNQSILEGGYQGFTSVQTIKSGGMFGLGIGKGVVKNYLPDAYSDFIFSVIGEELGLIGSVYLILIFIFMGYKSFKNNHKLQNQLAYYINISCMSMILIQAWINIASALWIIPTKGITLPFISHGGTSLMISFWTISGIFLASKEAQFSREVKYEFND